MITGIDHVVILTDDLSAAVRRFDALGFVVERGGSHPAWGTENALIPLADGSYLELLAARDPERAAQHRLWRRPGGGTRRPGDYGGYALESDDLAGDVQRIRNRGLALTDPQMGSRARPDGVTIRWRSAFSERPDLPFLIEDDTPRALRIAAPTRGLGARSSIAEVIVAGVDPAEAARAYEQLLGQPAGSAREAGGAPASTFATTRGHIAVARRRSDAEAGVQHTGHTESVDPGVYAMVLGITRWTEATREALPILRSEGDCWLIDPDATGGPRILLRAARGR